MKKILVVEDEENISKLICDTLNLGGYGYDMAFDGKIAVNKVLLARIELRIGKNNIETYKYKDIIVNTKERLVYKNNNQIALSPKEYDLLVLLLKNVGVALSRDIILNEIWNIDEDIETRTVDYHIGQLRTKLDLKDEIKAISKIGYRIEKE